MHLKTFVVLGAVIALTATGSAQADVPMNLMSYPNAAITVDGNAADWNLPQFGTVVPGGVAGTGDIALVGWDDTDTNLYYAGAFDPGGGPVLPVNKADHQAKVYARDNATTQYFLVYITDSQVNAADEAAWANDCIEFYIDPQDNGNPTDWESDTQLVIDAANQAQVWMSSAGYAAQIEAGVSSAVTLTAGGWLLEVGIDKSVFSPGLPSVLGGVNNADPYGPNYGIDFNFRDNDDPSGLGDRNTDGQYVTVYDWADPYSGGAFPSKNAGSWGDVVVPEPATLMLLVLGGLFIGRRRS